MPHINFLPCPIPRAAEKAEAEADAEDSKKKKSGIHVPEEWPWEEAKKVFEQPDVTPAVELEVSPRLSLYQSWSCLVVLGPCCLFCFIFGGGWTHWL
jgi:hypothetical protein